MSKIPKNLTLEEGILEKAEALMRLLNEDSVSGLIEQLIREEWQRRHGPLRFADAPPEPVPAPGKPVPRSTKPAHKPVHYEIKPKHRGQA